MQITHDHNQFNQQSQEVFTNRRMAFRVWQLTEAGKTLVELGTLLGMTGAGVSRMLDGERMPIKHHVKLVEAGVPEHLLPRPENVHRGRKPKIPQQET